MLPECCWIIAKCWPTFLEFSQNAAIFKSCWRLKLNGCKLVKILILRTFHVRFEKHLVFIYTNIKFFIKFSPSSPARRPASRMSYCRAYACRLPGRRRRRTAVRRPSKDRGNLSWKVRSARDRTIRTFHIWVRSKFCQNSVHFARKLKKFRIFQHVRKYLRNSDKFSSNSEQNSMKIK